MACSVSARSAAGSIFDACAEMTSAVQPSFRYLDTILKTYRLNGAVTAEAAAELRRARDAADELARMLFERAGIRRTPTLAQHEQIDAWHDKWHMDAELLLYAADESRAAAQPFANIKKLVTAWYGANVATVAAAQELICSAAISAWMRSAAMAASRATASGRSASAGASSSSSSGSAAGTSSISAMHSSAPPGQP